MLSKFEFKNDLELKNFVEKINNFISTKEDVYFWYKREDVSIATSLNKADSLKLDYDCDNCSIYGIDFKFRYNYVSSINSFDIKYLCIEFKENKSIESFTFYMKDDVTTYEIISLE